MCGASDQDTLPPLEVSTGEAVLHGTVSRNAAPLAGAYVRLLDATGEFTAEVQTGDKGYFRFYAAAGPWTLRVLARGAEPVDEAATAVQGQAVEVLLGVPV